MSCCQNNTRMTTPAMRTVEGYECLQKFNPNNFSKEDKTYIVGKQYYAPPWPTERTEFDSNLQAKFSTSQIPDFLNYSNVRGALPVETRKSIQTGRYDAYSY